MPARFNAKVLCLFLAAALTAAGCGGGVAPDDAADNAVDNAVGDLASEDTPQEVTPFGVPPGEWAAPTMTISFATTGAA